MSCCLKTRAGYWQVRCVMMPKSKVYIFKLIMKSDKNETEKGTVYAQVYCIKSLVWKEELSCKPKVKVVYAVTLTI